jgi:hypothetical protein
MPAIKIKQRDGDKNVRTNVQKIYSLADTCPDAMFSTWF